MAVAIEIAAPTTPVLPFLRARLGLMLFLQYAIYGIWMPIAARFLSASPLEGGLGFSAHQIGLIIAVAGAIGAICSPFIAGQIADRYFATEKFLAILLIGGGIVKFITAYQTSFSAWLSLSILYTLCYMPTIALTNSLAMSHLSDPKRQFPGVRVWGTIGWIVVAWAFPMIWLQTDLRFQWLPPFFKGDALPNSPGRMIDSFKVAGVLSVAYGVYCWLALPHTPPKRDAVQKLAFARAFALVQRRSFAVLLGSALLISIVHSIYFLQASKYLAEIGLQDAYLMPAMSIGQFAEIAIMAVLGRMLARFGFRTIITLGAFAYFLRYAVFGTVSLPLEVIVAAQFLHGFCFACFIATGFIYVDRIAPADVKHSVQTVFMMVLLGIGPLIAGWFNGFLEQQFRGADGRVDYSLFWYSLSLLGLAATIIIGIFFRDETAPSAPREKTA